MENKKLLDQNICEIIVSNIKSKYNKPQFQFTVMFLIFMLFYPLIRILIYILALLNVFIFKLMVWSKIYKFETVIEDVEIIS
jgi:hypothetical protein